MLRLPRVAAIASMVLGVACLAPGAVAAANPIPEAPSRDGRLVVTDDPSIVGGHPLRIDTWSRDEAGDAVSVQFSLVSPGCTGVHAEVYQTADSVAVALTEGMHPSDVGRMCSMIVVPATLAIPLEEPLGDRTVVSAAAAADATE